MSGICGWTGLPAPPEDLRHQIDAMAAALPGPFAEAVPNPSAAAAGTSALAARTTPQPGWLHADGTMFVAVCGRPRWDSPDLASAADRHGPARVLAGEYRRRGPEMMEALQGTFALAIVNDDTREAFLAVDRLGICGLAYVQAADGLLFASGAEAILRHPAAPRALRNQALFDYVYFHMVPSPESAYAGHERLLPGQYVRFHRGGLERRHYWRMRYSPHARTDFPELKREFLQCLEEAVADAVSGDRSVGAFLSGGTDSSTVAGMLSRAGAGPARTFSIGFDAQGYDETGYARIAARHFNTEHREYYVTPQDVVQSVPRIAAAYDQPYGNASALPTYYCARLAREQGIDRLLGGDGGDELFGGNSRYGKQNVFALYERLPSSLRRGLIEPLLGRDADRAHGPLRKIRRYVAQASIPLPDRAESYNLLTHFGPHNVFDADFLNSVDSGHPLAMVRDTYHDAQAENTIDRLLALDLKQTLADNDLPKVTRMCDLAGVEAAFPLLDHRLVEFSAHLPPEMKVRGTRLRVFFKKALADFLPQEILTKSKHGFGLPFGVWMTDYKPLHELAADSIARLRPHRIFRDDFLDRLLGRHLAEHASYYGTMVWILLMLSQWFDTRGAVPREGATPEIQA